MIFFKNHWKLILIGIGIIIVLFWINSITGTSRQLWNMVRDSIVQEEKKIQKDLEKEVERLDTERSTYISEINRLKTQREALENQNKELQGKLNEIQDRLNIITIPERLDDRVKRLRELGLKSAIVAPRPK